MLYRTFSTREKVLFVIFGLLLVGAVYYLLVFQPYTVQKEQLNNTILSQQDEMSLLEARYMELRRMISELEKLPDESELTPIPDYDNIQGVMNFLNTTLAAADNFSVSFASVDNSDQFVRRTLAINFSSEDEFVAKTIINQLFNAPYRNQVKTFAISYNNERGCNVTMNITFFEIQMK